MKKDIWEYITQNDQDGKVKPLTNLKDKPIFIYGSQFDTVIPLWNQLMQAELFHHYESEVSYVIGMDENHWLPHSVPKRGLQYIYEHIKGSSITQDKKL